MLDNDQSNYLLQELQNYLEMLETPREEYEGLPTCPFLKKERINNKLMIDIFDNNKDSFLDKMEMFASSDYTDAVFAQQIDNNISTKDSKDYQSFLNLVISDNFEQYKIIVINPNDSFSVKGYKPRSLAPCVLILVTERKKLLEAHNKILNSKYFTNFEDDYLNHLLVKKEDLNLK